jgi:hypothetical protein
MGRFAILPDAYYTAEVMFCQWGFWGSFVTLGWFEDGACGQGWRETGCVEWVGGFGSFGPDGASGPERIDSGESRSRL